MLTRYPPVNGLWSLSLVALVALLCSVDEPSSEYSLHTFYGEDT